MNKTDIHNKEEAVALVAAVMQSSPALLSPTFQLAMAVSNDFDVRAADVLEFKREVERRRRGALTGSPSAK